MRANYFTKSVENRKTTEQVRDHPGLSTWHGSRPTLSWSRYLMDGRNPDDRPLSAAMLVVVTIVVAMEVSIIVSKETIDVGLSLEAADERSAPEDELRSSACWRCRGQRWRWWRRRKRGPQNNKDRKRIRHPQLEQSTIYGKCTQDAKRRRRAWNELSGEEQGIGCECRNQGMGCNVEKEVGTLRNGSTLLVAGNHVSLTRDPLTASIGWLSMSQRVRFHSAS